MSDRTRLGLGLLGAALVLGVLGDELLRATPLGINLFLWFAALAVTLVVLARWRGTPLTVRSRWMLPPLLLFAALPAWRDSPWLVALDLFAVVAALAFGALRAPRVHRAGLADYVVGLGNAGAAATARTVTLMQRDIDWRDLTKGATGRAGGRRRARPAARSAAPRRLRCPLRRRRPGLPGLRDRCRARTRTKSSHTRRSSSCSPGSRPASCASTSCDGSRSKPTSARSSLSVAPRSPSCSAA